MHALFVRQGVHLPDVVVQLQASENFLRNRLMELDESELEINTHNDIEVRMIRDH